MWWFYLLPWAKFAHSFSVIILAGAYIAHCQTSIMELFCENSKGLKVLNYFHKKAPSQMFGRVLMPPLYNSEHVSLYRIIWWSKYWKLFWKIVLKYRIKMFFLLKMHANNRHLKLNFCWGVTRSFLGDFQKNHSAKRIQWVTSVADNWSNSFLLKNYLYCLLK